MPSPFISAEDARKGAKNNLLIHQEINALEEAILKAIDEKKLDTIVADNTPFTTVKGVESVNVLNGGSGYSIKNALISVDHPTGVNADIEANVTNGRIVSFVINNGGTGYSPIDASIDMTSSGDGNALLQPIVTDGVITTINILSGGSGYSVSDNIIFVHPTGINASAEIEAVSNNGSIISVNLINGGQGYSTINPELVITHPIGFGAKGEIVTNNGIITNIQVINGGVGYQPIKPSATVVDENGGGAVLSVNLNNGEITDIEVLQSGSNYTQNAEIVIEDVQGSNGSGAEAEAIVTESAYDVNTTEYYKVYRNLITDRAKKLELDSVIQYFENLGYNINIIDNPNIESTIAWKIIW